MSRKDYVLIAGALRDARVAGDKGFDWTLVINQGLDRAALAIAHVLARENPRFNRDRFLAACKP